MPRNSSTPAGAALPGDGLVVPAAQRLPQLYQAIAQLLDGEGLQEAADPSSPKGHLQMAIGRVLLPHLEAGLRALTATLREDLLVRIAQVQQVERLSGLEHDTSWLAPLLHGQVPARPLLAEPPRFTALPGASSEHQAEENEAQVPAPELPPGDPFGLELAPLEAEQPLSSAAAPRLSNFATPGEAAPEALSPEASPALASTEADIRLAAELWRQGDEDRALAVCSQVIQEDPTSAMAYLLRGKMYAQRRAPEHAIDDFTAAIAACPDCAEAYLRRSNLFFALGDLEQARQGYSATLELQPDLTAAYLNRGLTHAHQEAWPEAIADATAAIQRQPLCGNAYFIRGAAYFQQGDPQRALADLNHLLHLQPKNALAYNERGLVLASMGKYSQALANYACALRLKPHFLLARYNRARALMHHGDLDRALTAFSELIQLAPDDAQVYYHRAQIYRIRHQYAAAIADYERALELEPQSKEAKAGLQQLRRLALASRREPAAAPALAVLTQLPEAEEAALPQEEPAAEEKAASPVHDRAGTEEEEGRLQPRAAATAPEVVSTPATATAAAAVKEPQPAPPPAQPVAKGEAAAPAQDHAAAENEGGGAEREAGNARRLLITLTCNACGTVSQVGIDRLNRKFQCRKCQRVYAVQPDGQLNELVRRQTRSERLRTLARNRLRLWRAAAALLVVSLGAWYGWRTFLSARSLPALPDELETRAQMLVKAWVNQDTETVQLLTTPTQESQVHTWLRANRFPLSLEELKASRTWIHQTKIEVHVLKEKRDNAQLSILVSTPVSSPVKLEQQWVRVGKGWYFQPFPVYRGNVVVTGPPPVTAVGTRSSSP